MKKIFLGIKGHVVCLNKETGKEIWRTKMISTTITNVCYEESFIFAYAGGHFFCLNSNNGNIIWENGLAGMGYGPCIIASENQNSAVVANQLASQQAQVTIVNRDEGSGDGDGGGDGGGE